MQPLTVAEPARKIGWLVCVATVTHARGENGGAMTRAERARFTITGTVIAVSVLMALSVPAAAQAPPLTGSGSAVITEFLIPEPGEPGGRIDLGNSGNWQQTRTLRGETIDGPLDGTVEQVVTGIVRDRTNEVTFHGTMTFTGTVQGCEGEHTLTLAITGRGQASPPVTEARVQVLGQSSVNGGGTVSQVGTALTYDIQYVCR
jgi:hypothetical protein